MDHPTIRPDPDFAPPAAKPRGAGVGASIDSFRTRVISGLLLALPIAITTWIVYQLYLTVHGLLLDPIARLVALLFGDATRSGLPSWWVDYAAPLIGIGLALVVLYLLGYLVRTRVIRALDWFLLRLPLVTIIYRAVRSVFQSLEEPGMGFKRVVLVEFPHPGMRSLAFVTKTLRDEETGKTILCVCVLTGVMPPSGFTLFVNEDDVTDVDWSVRDTLQAITSGGITAPPIIRFYRRGGAMTEAELLVDRAGRPIHHAEPAAAPDATPEPS